MNDWKLSATLSTQTIGEILMALSGGLRETAVVGSAFPIRWRWCLWHMERSDGGSGPARDGDGAMWREVIQSIPRPESFVGQMWWSRVAGEMDRAGHPWGVCAASQDGRAIRVIIGMSDEWHSISDVGRGEAMRSLPWTSDTEVCRLLWGDDYRPKRDDAHTVPRRRSRIMDWNDDDGDGPRAA